MGEVVPAERLRLKRREGRCLAHVSGIMFQPKRNQFYAQINLKFVRYHTYRLWEVLGWKDWQN
jgi:hypothetical protein